MCKKLILLTLLLAVLGLTSASFADDPAPPAWAGEPTSDGYTTYLHWTFEEGPLNGPAEWDYISPPVDQNIAAFGEYWPEWSWHQTDQDEEYSWVVEDYGDQFPYFELDGEEQLSGMIFVAEGPGEPAIAAEWADSFEGRQGVVSSVQYMQVHFFGAGDVTGQSERIRLQVTYNSVEPGDIPEAAGYREQGDDGEELPMELIETIPISGDWKTAVFEIDLDYSPGGWQFVEFWDVDGIGMAIDQIVLDVITWADGEEPPEGSGREPSFVGPPGPTTKATNPVPESGAEEVDSDALTELVWDDPNTTVLPPETTSYKVWFGPNDVVTDNPNEITAVNSISTDLLTLEGDDWGTTYYWRVDVINEPVGAPNSLEEGDPWMFTTGGIPSLIWPEDADWWIHDPNTYFEWEGDMYAGTYNFYLEDDNGDIVDSQTLLTDPNYTCPVDLNDVDSYNWYVEEVNTTYGFTIASETWSFETWNSTGKPHDDWLGAGNTKDITWSSNVDEGVYSLLSDEFLTIETMTDMTAAAGAEGWFIDGDPQWQDNNEVYPLTGEPNETPWLMLDLGYDYDLWLMWLWNCNGWTPEGIDEYEVHYVDESGAPEENDPNTWSWTQLGGTESLAEAPGDEFEDGLDGYTGAAGPSFEGTTARYVVINILSGLDNDPFDILAKLKIELQPRLSAYGPTPANRETDVEIDTDLSWYAGLEADGHDVYLSDELIGEKDISLTITWQSPNLVPQGESWGWDESYWLEWGYDMNTAETVDGNWKTTTIEFSPDDNPTGEGIGLTYELAQKEMIYIDKVVIDTDCNPTFSGGQTHAEWVFDTNGFGEEEPNGFPDVYTQDEGGDTWAVMSWIEGGAGTEHLDTYDTKSGVWALDANGWAEMSFELGNFAETEIPYLGATGAAGDVTYGDDESLGPLDLDTTYYWRVDEVNDTPADSPSWKGSVWEFTTVLCVSEDDFESYVIGGSPRVYDDDSGGWGAYNSPNQNDVFKRGSDPIPDRYNAMGILEENAYVYEGGQSMRMNYTWALMPFNAGSGASCYARKDLGGVDLAGQGATTVSIAYLADAGNPPDSTDELFVELEDTSANVGRVVVGSIAAATDWTVAEIAIQDFNGLGVDENSVQYLRIGATTGKTESDGNLNADMYVDAQIRCAPACLASSSVAADLSGPDGEPDCIIDAWDLAALTGEWLSEDYYVTPTGPADGNELVEYLFASDLTDTSGGPGQYDGVASGAGAAVAGGVLTLDGSSSVEVANDFNGLTLFDGNEPFTIAMDFKTAAQGMLISSARPQGAMTEGEYSDTHSMALFAHEPFEEVGAGVSYDNFWVSAARALDSPMDDTWHTVVMVFDANTAIVYLDGVAGEMNEALDPDIPQAQLDTPLIGSTLNTVYPAEIGVGDFSGEIDNVRIYQQALTAQEALYLMGATDPVYFGLGAENLSDDEAEGDEIIDFKDYAELMKYWLGEYLLK